PGRSCSSCNIETARPVSLGTDRGERESFCIPDLRKALPREASRVSDQSSFRGFQKMKQPYVSRNPSVSFRIVPENFLQSVPISSFAEGCTCGRQDCRRLKIRFQGNRSCRLPFRRTRRWPAGEGFPCQALRLRSTRRSCRREYRFGDLF